MGASYDYRCGSVLFYMEPVVGEARNARLCLSRKSSMHLSPTLQSFSVEADPVAEKSGQNHRLSLAPVATKAMPLPPL